MMTNAAQAIVDGIMFSGRAHSYGEYPLVVPSPGKKDLEWLYNATESFATERVLVSTSRRARERDYYIQMDNEDVDLEDERDFDYRKQQVCELRLVPNDAASERIQDWYGPSGRLTLPYSFRLKPVSAEVLYRIAASENPSGDDAYTTFQIDYFNDEDVKRVFREAGFDLEGCNGLFRLDAEESAKFRAYIEVAHPR